MADNSTIIEKVKKLLSMNEANGCTPEEASLAIARAQLLLAKYGLSESDLTEDERKIIEEEVTVGTKSVSNLQSLLAVNLAKHFACEVVRCSLGSSSYLKFIGDAIKVAVFKETFMFAYLCFKRSWAAYHKTLSESADKNLIRGAFFKGFVKGITDELTRSENANAIVLVKSKELTEYMSQMSLSKGSPIVVRSNSDYTAYSKGYEEGSFAQRNKNKTIAD